MIRQYLKIIIQNFIRNKGFSTINVLGLASGLAVCFIIFLYVRFEKSFDNFHENVENKYRAILGVTHSTGDVVWDAANYAPVGPALVQDFPEVKSFVRISPEYGRAVFNYNNTVYEEQKVYYADSSFFTFFGYKLLEGDPKAALNRTGTVVLSLASAEKYFGPRENWTESPVQKTITINGHLPLTITGIMENFPENSHFQSNAIISFLTFLQFGNPLENWGWNDFYTYLELAPGSDYKVFEAKLPELLKKYKKENDNSVQMQLQPLQDIHLRSNVGYELSPNGSIQTVYFLSIIALVILVIAWVNYINLTTSKAESRAKEIGVRKVNGAGRGNLIAQFLMEAFFMNFIALLAAVFLVYLILPFAGQLIGRNLSFSFFSDSTLLIYLLCTYVLGSILSGLYPALVLSSYKPSSIFKVSSKKIASGSLSFRQALVIFQFVMSAGLITGTLIIENQMHYIRNKELGYNYDNAIVLNAPSTLPDDSLFFIKFNSFKQNLLTVSGIEKVAVSSALPGKSQNDMDTAGGLRMAGDDEQVNHTLASFRIDEGFSEVFDLKVIAGQNLSFSNLNKDKVLLNRKGAELLGYTNPEEIIGKKLKFWGKDKEIVGVLENYHHRSLKNQIEPMVMRGDISNMLYIIIRPSSQQSTSTDDVLSQVQAHWDIFFPADPFEFSFLDEHVNNQYKADNRFSAIFSIFSGFSIFIACLGLFGLVSYAVSARIKEIGIRKVLGASIGSILLLFTKDYVKLMAAAFVIGIPLAHYILTLWLENFAYRAALSWEPFIYPAGIVMALVIMTISVQIINAALKNPANSLRSE